MQDVILIAKVLNESAKKINLLLIRQMQMSYRYAVQQMFF